MQTDAPSIVIIPTYNEHETLVPLVQQVLDAAPGTDVLIVDDASPDGTGALADSLAAVEERVDVIHREGKQGLASAYREGFQHALDRGYELITQMDADFSHRPEDLPRLLEGATDADVVVGSRNVAGGRTEGWPWLRKLVSRGGSVYTRTLLRLPIHDCTSGFKCIRRRALASIDINDVSSAGFGFQVEMNFLFHRAGMQLAEVPIVFPNRTAGESKMSRDIFMEAMTLVWRLRWANRPRAGQAAQRVSNRSRRLLARHGSRFLRFAAVGGAGVAVNSGLLYIFVSQAGLAPLIAAGVATEVSILSNFALNDAWTFRGVRGNVSRIASAARYNLNALGGFGLSLAVLAFLTQTTGIHYMLANLFAIGSATLWNYVANVRWTWPTLQTTNQSARRGAGRG
ncbi:MAG TPA: glycosyltransferase family 2 protein [Thermomicrobiales bacterium]|nr:glycosyltransferase family 2 protein [Thermomicrobiales bacterium]